MNKLTRFANVVINHFKDFTEVLYYHDEFVVLTDAVTSNVDRTRKFVYDENGVLNAIDDSVKISDLKRSIENSRTRSLDNLYGYVLSNEWNYFVTLTFSPKKIDTLNRDDVLYVWQKFRQKMQRYEKNIKLIVVIEFQKKGGIHFHGFAGNCDLDEKLKSATNNREFLKDNQGNYILKNGKKVKNPQYRELLYTKFGDQIFNFKDDYFEWGYTTLVKMRPGSNNLQLANYLTKYMTKDNNSVAYNKKTYMRTYNLDFKNKYYSMLKYEDLFDILAENKFELVKNNEKFISFRLPKNADIELSDYDLRTLEIKEQRKLLKENLSKLNSHERFVADKIFVSMNKENEQINIEDIF